jgi:pimeloyl-ACP methyl ester carboxylesterase
MRKQTPAAACLDAPRRLLAALGAGLAAAAVAALAPAALGIAGLTFSGQAEAVECGYFNGHTCDGTAYQYGGGFDPYAGEYGGFGGGDCTATRTPVIFIHGNGDNSTSWDAPPTQVSGYYKAPRSVYEEFKYRGYNDCELFGVTWLSSYEQDDPLDNYHKPSKYDILHYFIQAVKAYTGYSKVDIVAHSMGVTLAGAGLQYWDDFGSVRRFVNIAGGLHGLDSCYSVGYANPYVTTCGSENIYDGWVFGFYPDTGSGINSWTSTWSSWGLTWLPYYYTNTRFYTILAGFNDQVMCTASSDYDNCPWSPYFDDNTYGNVKAQLWVGTGSEARHVDWDWENDGWPYVAFGGDEDGVGHLHARDNTGSLVYRMLSSSCTGSGCADIYEYYGPVWAY